jgi:hypothetical protein
MKVLEGMFSFWRLQEVIVAFLFQLPEAVTLFGP